MPSAQALRLPRPGPPARTRVLQTLRQSYPHSQLTANSICFPRFSLALFPSFQATVPLTTAVAMLSNNPPSLSLQQQEALSHGPAALLTQLGGQVSLQVGRLCPSRVSSSRLGAGAGMCSWWQEAHKRARGNTEASQGQVSDLVSSCLCLTPLTKVSHKTKPRVQG